MPDVRLEVEKLLRAYAEAGNFMEQSPLFEMASGETDWLATLAPHAPEHSTTIDKLPCLFGDYELLEKIAQGGMGVVYKARQISLNRTVAVKMILSGQIADPDEIKRFYVEAEAAGKVNHPGIVPVFDVGCVEDRHFISMAFIEGQSLSTRIQEGSFSPREAASLMCKVCEAMQVAHENGIVHRDLKPGNVLLDENSEPRITDFGLAKRLEEDSELTRTGMILGTPGYMPPEQATGQEIDSLADVYSIGAMLYAMLTGRAPFSGTSQLETIMMVIENEPTNLRQLNKAIPKDIEAICLKCLEKKPKDRYQSANELLQDLNCFLAGEPIKARKGLSRRIRKWSIREPALAAHAGATLVILALLLINFWVFGHRGEGREHSLWILKLNWGTICSWLFLLFVLQKLQNVYKTKSIIPIVWSACNPVFMTLIIALNAPPRDLLVATYFLLLVTSCLFRRVELVIVSTLSSLIGFSFLVVLFFHEMGENLSYLIVFGVNMAVAGIILSFVSLRLKRLGQRNETARQR